MTPTLIVVSVKPVVSPAPAAPAMARAPDAIIAVASLSILMFTCLSLM